MNKKALQADLLLLLTSCIWGLAFTAQRTGMDFLGPFTFNAIRFAMGSISLLPLIFFLNVKRRKESVSGINADVEPETSFKMMIGSSFLAGIVLYGGATLQQIGMIYTTAGNAGFVTSLYVVLVPIFGLFIGRKTGIPTWVGAAATLIGLFFISRAEAGTGGLNPGIILVALSAPLWACHVLLIDRLVKKIDPLILSAGQFAFCALFSLIPALFTESISMEAFKGALAPLLYSGLGSVGVAYTLQAVAQQHAPPAHASILLCLESVFAAIGGIIILGEPLGPRTFLGFACMFAGMIATQWDVMTGGSKKKGGIKQNRKK